MKINGHFVTPPTLVDLLEAHAEDTGAKLRVCMPGTIKTYDAVKRTASVVVAENFVLNNGTVAVMPYPLLDVPVVTLQGGGVHVGLPVQPGDECLLVFADFNIDAWYVAGGQQTPPDARQHNISDAFAFVGPNSLANPLLTALLATEGGLAAALAKVAINPLTNLITIANGPLPANKLGGILALLFTTLAADPSLSPASQAALTAAVAQLAALLY